MCCLAINRMVCSKAWLVWCFCYSILVMLVSYFFKLISLTPISFHFPLLIKLIPFLHYHVFEYCIIPLTFCWLYNNVVLDNCSCLYCLIDAENPWWCGLCMLSLAFHPPFQFRQRITPLSSNTDWYLYLLLWCFHSLFLCGDFEDADADDDDGLQILMK